MPKVLVVGAMGRMGERVRAAISEAPQLEVGAALEVHGHPSVGSSIAGAIEISDDPKAWQWCHLERRRLRRPLGSTEHPPQ